MNAPTLEQLARKARALILTSTTQAESGHPTSSLSATDLMVGLMFGGSFRFDPKRPHHPGNDRLIFSKGHAAPLFYALWALAGGIEEKELLTLRKHGSRLEGHPSMHFPFTEAPTGSLGQGLSIGLGMALAARLDHLPSRTFVLLGDSEMAEGSVWEAIERASHARLDRLIGILDVNRLGQRGETMVGHNLKIYRRRLESFGWKTITIDGHRFVQMLSAIRTACATAGRPTMIIAKTLKGKGISFLEDREGWHGKVLTSNQCNQALHELGVVDPKWRGHCAAPTKTKPLALRPRPLSTLIIPTKPIATRKAYGEALVRLFPHHPEMVVLDAEVGNSTYAELFQHAYPKHFFEMYIAEQNMIGAALGLSARGKKPFVSTFAAFLTRAFDQLRMAQYGRPNMVITGSHAGVAIGQDGMSQMGLQDLAMMRTLLNAMVFVPSDAVATHRLMEIAAQQTGLFYLRTQRNETPILYNSSTRFKIGGSQVLKKSAADLATIVACGLLVHEALKAAEMMKKQGLAIRVIDAYCVKPIDQATLRTASKETLKIIVLEDHVPEGGLADAVRSAISDHPVPVTSLACAQLPMSGNAQELLRDQGLTADHIITHLASLK